MLKKVAVRFNIALLLAGLAAAYAAFFAPSHLFGGDPDHSIYGVMALVLIAGIWLGGNMGLIMAAALLNAERRGSR